MKYRMLDKNGDYQFGHSLQDITYGVYAVAQAVKTRLLLFQGEWWEDMENGLPLFQRIIGQRFSQQDTSIVDSLIKERIITTENVAGISDFQSSYSPDSRNYSFECTIQTPFGNAVVARTF